MAECSECGKQTMSFTCHYCGEKFCSEHRLPENHDCEGLESGKKEEFLESEEVEEASEDKWFDEKFERNKVRNEARNKNTRKNSFLRDVLDTFRNSYTLSIILFTSLFFVLAQITPVLNYALMLFPNIGPESLAPALQSIAETLGYTPSLSSQPWGLLTVLLVHGGLFHLMANMITLYFFGDILEKAIGGRKFLKFYIGTGIIASLAYVLMSNVYYVLHGATFSSGIGTMTPAVGASGAVVAALGAVAVLYPHAEVLLYFVFPMKIQTAVKAFGVLETINIMFKLSGTTLPVIGGFASSAHLAGLLIGVFIGLKMRDSVSKTSRLNLLG